MTTITKHLLPHEYMGFFRRLEELPVEEQVHAMVAALILQDAHLMQLKDASGIDVVRAFKNIEHTFPFMEFALRHKDWLNDDVARMNEIRDQVKKELGL